MKTARTTLLVFSMSLLTLAGCNIRFGYPINYEQLSEELSDYEIAKTAFDQNDPLLQKRVVLISGGFNRSMTKTICKQLIYLDEQSQTEPIMLLINSSGGDCTSYQSITGVIKSLDAPVDTVNIGTCASMGALLIQSATGTRYALKDTMFMIHEPSGRPKEFTQHYRKLQEEVLRTRCNFPESWLPIGDREHIFSAAEALEYQFVDEVIEAMDL